MPPSPRPVPDEKVNTLDGLSLSELTGWCGRRFVAGCKYPPTAGGYPGFFYFFISC